jgi:hypothetical protein
VLIKPPALELPEPGPVLPVETAEPDQPPSEASIEAGRKIAELLA